MYKRKYIRIICFFFVCLIVLENLPISYLDNLWNKANAAPGDTVVTFNYNSTTAKAGYESFYDKNTTLNSNNFTIQGVPGKVIKEVKWAKDMGAPQVITLAGAVGNASWTGNIPNVSGKKVGIESMKNTAAMGYYAWDRYSPGGTRGVDWHMEKANGETNVCGAGAPTEVFAGVAMPKYPNCTDNNLTVPAVRDKGYVLEGTTNYMDASVVNISQAVNTAVPKAGILINGPAGIPFGFSDPTTTVVSVTTTSADQFTVRYSQNFNHEGYYKDHAALGARMMVYYAAFEVNLKAHTYQYPDRVYVTYENGTGGADLGSITLAQAGQCVQTGVMKTFNFSFTNNGATAYTGSVNVKIFIGSTELVSIPFSNIAGGATKSGSFNYIFSDTVTKTIHIKIDPIPGESTTDNNEQYSFTAQTAACGAPTPTPTPNGPETITGDFTIEKSIIKYKETNKFTAVGVSVSGGGCTLSAYEWQVQQGTKKDWWYGTKPSGPTTQDFNGPPYPGNIVIGTVEVRLEITSTCGTVKVIGPKTFEMIDDPANPNRPPVFSGGWFMGGSTYPYPPIQEVVVGNYVGLGIVKDPSTNPLEPYDPDGDGIMYHWDFKNSTDPWIKSLWDNFGYEKEEYYGWIKADVLGSHTVVLNGNDTRGAAAPTKYVTLNVVPPNPVAVISGPSTVVEGRAISTPWSAAGSYSPMGRSINHSMNEWTNKQDIYYTPGTQNITLMVYDSDGLKSLNVANHQLQVKEDLPPIASVNYQSLMVRGSAVPIKDTSHSPDGDPISALTHKITCDKNNNSSYADDTVLNMTLDSQGRYNFTPTQVGKCKIDIFIKEGLGYQKSATGTFYFEVVNDSPTADFTVSGNNPEPPIITTTTYPATTLSTSTTWKDISDIKRFKYNSVENAIQTTETIEPYKSIGPNNVVKTTFSMYCSQYQLQGCGPIQPQLQIGPNIYGSYGWDNGSYAVKWHNLAATYATNPVPGTLNSKNIGNGYSEYYRFVNREQGLIWVTAPTTYYVNGVLVYSYINYLYRISDVINSIPTTWANAYEPTPISSTTGDRTVPPPGFNPPPDRFTELPFAGAPRSGKVRLYDSQTGYTGSFTDYGTYGYDKDENGNSYNMNCHRSTTGFICSLLTVNPSGTTITTSSKFNTGNHLVGVLHRTKDRIVLGTPSIGTNSQLGGFVILRSNGTVLVEQSQADMSSVGLSHVISVGNTSVVAEKSPPISYWGSDMRIKLRFYNTSTGAIIATHLVKTYKSKETYSNGYADYLPYLNAIVSADNKIIVQNFFKNILVYDLLGNQLADIPAMSNDPGDTSWQDGSNSRHTLPMPSLFLSADGELKAQYQTVSRSAESSYSDTSVTVLSFKSDVFSGDSDRASFGQLINDSVTFKDGEASLDVKFNTRQSDTTTIGLGFKIFNNLNMYRAEVTPTKTRLVKVVAGVRTILGETNFNLNYEQYYSLKVKVNGSRIRIYLGGTPIIDKTDTTYTTGKIGPFSEAANSLFRNFAITTYVGSDSLIENVGLVGSSLTYNKTYSDPENDPAIASLSSWSFTHTEPNKFLDALDGYSGLSALHGQTVTSPYLELDKVGKYKLTYKIPDDPAPAGYKFPNNVFADYRKYSDLAEQTVIIHRKPIAVFTLSVAGDNTVNWTDNSYDPDRWLSTTKYSTEATGINYRTTKGVVDRRYSYTDPAGNTQFGKLTRPEITGTYIVRLAVKDEYGAWSDWVEQTININIPVPNSPPTAVLTFPNGTQANPSYVNTLQPTITWNQADPDANTTFAAYQVQIKNAAGTVLVDSGTKPQGTTANSASWVVSQNLTLGSLYQVVVRVSDGNAWSNWSNVGWMITNRPPTATMTVPSGKQAVPTLFSTTRPELKWSQTDPDPGTTFTQFQVQITNEANNVIVKDSGIIAKSTTSTTGSWIVNSDLPTGVKLRVWVRVHDGYVWSSYSPQTWMYINRPPVAAFDWSPKPVWEGDMVSLSNQSSDPDGDALTYTWKIVRPDSSVVMTDVVHWTNRFDLPGDYKVTLTASDGIAVHSITKTIKTAPLTIQSDVTYTSRWLQLHEERGHNTLQPPKDFYSGEIFVVATRSSPAPVAEARAWLDTVGLDGKAIFIEDILVSSGDPLEFKGELFDPILQSMTGGLPPGVQMIHFQIRYLNGTVRKQDIPVHIIGNVQKSFGVHRVR